MRARLIPVLALVLLAALAPAADAGRWVLSPYAGFLKQDGEYGHIATTLDALEAKDAANFGGRIAFVDKANFGIEFAGGITSSTLEATTPAVTADLSFWYATANIIYMPEPQSWGAPFLSTGLGLGHSTADGITPANAFQYPSEEKDQLDQMLFDLAGGWVLPLSGKMGLRAEVRNLLWIPHNKIESARLNHLLFGGALQFAFGGAPPTDSDGDGVTDKKDKCPDTPRGATVNATGCTSDADGDGVVDGIDTCPNTPKGVKVDAKGCPMDSDGDGVFDGVDQCADTPKGAKVDAKGCPSDGDGDGVWDGIDQCPGTPKGALVDAKGCPTDADGDGVFDGLDKCPGTGASLRVDADGCPIEVTERETELLDTGMIRLQNVNFETGKSDILPESFPTLDNVGLLLQRWPQLQIEIGGHTDARGTAKANQALSEARAQSVLTYLTGKYSGLNAGQFTVKGYGESKPIAPNNNAVNMAKNRRVEFVVLNKDVLKKEIENRKQLQK